MNALTEPLEEPDYIRQTGEVMTPEEAHEWFQCAAAEARANGITHARFSYHPTIEHLRIVEGWKTRPVDEGEIRWALTSEAPAHDH